MRICRQTIAAIAIVRHIFNATSGTSDVAFVWVDRDRYKAVANAVELDGYADHVQSGTRAAQGC